MIKKTENKDASQAYGAASRKLVERELHAHAMRNRLLVRGIARNVPWAILIGTLDAELRLADLSIEEISATEGVPAGLVLRWARALADHELILIKESHLGTNFISLQPDGRRMMAEYHASLENCSD